MIYSRLIFSFLLLFLSMDEQLSAHDLGLPEFDPRYTRRFLYENPEALSEDYEATFQQLMCECPDANVYAIVNGQSIDRIIDVEAMPAGRLVAFTLDYSSGPVRKVVRAEEIEEMGIRGRCRRRDAIRLHFPDSTNYEDAPYEIWDEGPECIEEQDETELPKAKPQTPPAR